MLPPARIFRVFVSSTFADLSGEREALHQKVFPLLRQLCLARGARFQAVDLRWGVSEEAARDQRTMRVCLQEISRCQRVSTELNFMVVLGNRYGWRPLPATIPEHDFTRLLTRAASSKRDSELTRLYKDVDQNAEPIVYCLRPRTPEIDADWNALESGALSALTAAAAAEVDFGPFERATYGGSATEQEIYQGLLAAGIPNDPCQHVHAFLRELDYLPPSEMLLSDWTPAGPDLEARQRLDTLKQQLRLNLPVHHVHQYDVVWTGSAIRADYLGEVTVAAKARAIGAAGSSSVAPPGVQNFCQDVYDSLAGIIEAETAAPDQGGGIAREMAAHAAFAAERGNPALFTGRTGTLNDIAAYLDASTDSALGLLGPAGSGKSAVIARAFLDATQRRSDAVVVGRFIGVTPDSVDGRALLAGLCAELAVHYGSPQPAAESEFPKLTRMFREHLQLAEKTGRTLLLFLDALDQLSDTNNERELHWLPLDKLPPKVRLVVSAASDEARAAGAISRRLPKESISPLERMSDAEGGELLERWLDEANRKLQPEQRDRVLGPFRDCPWPLYLRFAFEEARLWRSFDRAPRLAPRLADIIRQTFARLTSDAYHGRALVSGSLACLAAARDGMMEEEILDLLSEDAPAMAEFKRRFPKSPPIGRMPDVVWSLLYYDLKPYLTERNAHGMPVLAFFHRQLRDACTETWLAGADAVAVHTKLADYFARQTDPPAANGHRAFNVRKLSELPYQQQKAGMFERLHDTLTDLSFIESKCAAGLLYELLSDYDSALASAGLRDTAKARVAEFARFIRAQSHLLRDHPELTFQQALNQPDSSEVSRVARALAARETRPYFSWINKPQVTSPCLMTLSGHTGYVNTCDVSHDGARILSGSADEQVKVWDANTGRELLSLRGHKDSVETCSFSEDGKRVVSGARNGELKLWDAESGNIVRSFAGHRRELATCRISSDSRRVLSASWDGTVKVWDVETGAELHSLPHAGQAYSCDITRDGRWIVSATNMGALRLWNAETGAALEPFAGHEQAITECRFSFDGTRVYSASQDGTVKRWNVESRACELTYEGHQDSVWTLAVSKDGTRVVSGSSDGSVIFWDGESGEIIANVKEHLNQVWGLALFPDASRAVSASWDTTLKVWSFEAAEHVGKGWQHTPIEAADTRTERLWGYMIACACSPDGSLYAAGSSDGSLRVWDAATGRAFPPVRVHKDFVFACTFSPDSEWLLSGCWDGTVGLLNVSNGSQLSAPRHSDMVLACGFLAGGQRLFSCSTDGVRFCDIADGAVVERSFWQPEGKPTTCVFAPDGSWFVIGFDTGALAAIDSTSRAAEEFAEPHDGLSCCALSRDGRVLATGSQYGTIKLWDVASRRLTREFAAHIEKVVSCNFSRDGRRLVSAGWDRTIKIWAVEQEREPLVLRSHTDELQDACFSPDGARILSASVDCTVRLWDAAAGWQIGSLLSPPDSTSSCAFSRDGSYAVSGSHRHALKLWNGTTGELVHILSGHENAILACDFAYGGQLVSASADGTLKLWNPGSGEATFTLDGHDGPVDTCQFFAGGRRLVSGGRDGTVRVWATDTGRELWRSDADRTWVCVVLPTRDDRHIVACSQDGNVRIIDVQAGRPVRTFRTAGALITAGALSPHAGRLVTGDAAGLLTMWSVYSGERLGTLTGHTGAIRQCAWSDYILSASADGTLRAWYPDGERGFEPLRGHAGPVVTCAFLSDGRLALSGSEDQFVKLWNVETGTVLAQYWAGASVQNVVCQPGTRRIGVGDAAGKFHLLELNGLA